MSGGAAFTGCIGDCAPVEVCEDTDNGFADAYGDDCAAYAMYPSWCGGYDTADFDSMSMC